MHVWTRVKAKQAEAVDVSGIWPILTGPIQSDPMLSSLSLSIYETNDH